MASAPRVFTIPASAQFLPTLIEAVMTDRLGLGFKPGTDPLALADLTIYLPTRRACRLMQHTFLKVIGRDAAILPRMVPVGDVDPDEILFAEAAAGELHPDAIVLPEALGGLERKILLAKLILHWAKSPEMRSGGHVPLVANSPATALALAGDLARLMDDMATRQVPWKRLDDLVPDELDEYWHKTLRFLKIARDIWPKILAERDRMEPAERRDRLIAAEQKRLEQQNGPVIAAGSTGSIPATAKLLAAIARLPQGALVLPGLDTDLDAATWDQIENEDGDAAHSHPQFALHSLLKRIGILRESVMPLGEPAAHGRELMVSEAMRPADATELWQHRLKSDGFVEHANAALNAVAVIEAGNAEEEALAIAVALREAMEAPDKTAALVTPDRALARRVLAALARWNVPVDDSGGDTLADTPSGVFARLVAEAALEGLPPIKLLAMLKHGKCEFDRGAVAALERAVLRGPRPKPGSAGLADALASFRAELAKVRRGEDSSLHRSDPRATLSDAELDAAADLVGRLNVALAPLESLTRQPAALAKIAGCHADVLQALGCIDDDIGKVFEEIAKSDAIEIEPADYPELFHAAVAERVVRRPEMNVRVRIFGPLEARLQSVDRLILGGLVEGVWPPEPRSDPWLSRPMRHQLGLDLPERRIGLSAHDFAQALGAPEVILSRAARQGGAPTVASRFVQRLAAVAGEERWKVALKKGERYLTFARMLDESAGPPKPAARPEPKPPFEARPKRLSVTEIEHWLRDPYTIYAKHVLKLQPLDEIDTAPGAADRGTVIHNSIGDFVKAHGKTLPDNPVHALIEIGQRHFAPLSDYPEAKAFWWPRFLRIAEWFARYDADRRKKLSALHAEISGSINIPFGNEEFKLTVRADRIECLADGRYAILDYKTGAPPTDKQVRTGLSPQLTLEAAILRQGGFKDIPSGGSVAELVYVRLSGGAEAGEEKPIPLKDSTPDAEADKALAELAALLSRFADPSTPYYSLVHPMWSTHYGTYDHLARVKEWSLTGGTGDNGSNGGGE